MNKAKLKLIMMGVFFFWNSYRSCFFFHFLPPKKYLKLNLLKSHMEIQFVNKAKLKLIMMGVFFFLNSYRSCFFFSFSSPQKILEIESIEISYGDTICE